MVALRLNSQLKKSNSSLRSSLRKELNCIFQRYFQIEELSYWRFESPGIYNNDEFELLFHSSLHTRMMSLVLTFQRNRENQLH